MGIPIRGMAVSGMPFRGMLSVPFVLLWLASQQRTLGDGPFRHGYRVGLFRHGRGEAVAIDQN